jgi:hypothetical protein
MVLPSESYLGHQHACMHACRSALKQKVPRLPLQCPPGGLTSCMGSISISEKADLAELRGLALRWLSMRRWTAQ